MCITPLKSKHGRTHGRLRDVVGVSTHTDCDGGWPPQCAPEIWHHGSQQEAKDRHPPGPVLHSTAVTAPMFGQLLHTALLNTSSSFQEL